MISRRTGEGTGDSSRNAVNPDLLAPPGAASYQEIDRLDKWIMANIDSLPDDFVALPMNHSLINGVLTKQRIRILNHLREHGPVDSLQDLAESLDRDRSAVSRDLVSLEALIEVKKHGRQKQIRALDRPIIIY